MAETLRGGLSLACGGFACTSNIGKQCLRADHTVPPPSLIYAHTAWSMDIGGFEGTPPEHIFCRWVAFGLFLTHVRLPFGRDTKLTGTVTSTWI